MNLDEKQTTIHLDIRFEEDGQYYHLLNYIIYPHDDDDNDNLELTAYPERLSFTIDKTLQTNGEIAEAVVNFLSPLRLYLNYYSIANNRMYVSYTRKTPAFNDKLAYSPTRQELALYINAEVQKENGVDYEKELNIKLHHPISAITPKEIKDFGLRYTDCGVKIPTILREDELPDLPDDY